MSATGPFLGIACGVLFAVSLALFLANTMKRRHLDAALARAAREHGSTKPLKVPEREPTYDQKALIEFIEHARSQQIGGRRALDYYARTILTWDMCFAAAFALFIAAADLLAADRLASSPWAARAFLIFACIGVLYGVADLAEDFMLRKIFRHAEELEAMRRSSRGAAEAGKDGAAKEVARQDSRPADAAQSDAANALTRLKLVTIAASVIGGLVFVLIFLPLGWIMTKVAPAPARDAART
jgi:hypothetical protein